MALSLDLGPPSQASSALTGCVALSNYLQSGPQVLHLLNGDNTSTCLLIKHIKCLKLILVHNKECCPLLTLSKLASDSFCIKWGQQ